MSSPGTNNTIFRLQVQGDQQVIQKFKQVAQSMQQVQPAAQKVTQSSNQASTALKSTGQAASSSSTGIKTYHGALTSLGSANNTAKSSTDAFTGSLGNFSKTNTLAVGGLNETNTVTKGLVPTMGGLDTQVKKTGTSVNGLTNFFRGNRGLIFSVTMLSSGISEAISMFQGYQDASEKLAAAKQKVADMEERGLANTKEYGEAVKDVSDAQRGFNFIQRFTIQSFADLMPMSLMLTSSLLDMTGKVGGLSAAKTKLIGIGGKLIGVIKAVGVALWTALTSHPILAIITAISAAIIALITNFGGFRDAVNQLGVALGNALAPLKPLLEMLGLTGNQALDTANSFLTMGQTASAATTDMEKQVLKTGDATMLSFQEQINMMNKLGDEAENVFFSMGAHLLKQQQDQEAHKQKYAQFVDAMQTGNEDIMQSLQLTGEEFTEFSEQFQEDLEAMDEKFGTMVDSIIDNWSRVNEGFGESVDSTVGEIIKLEKKIEELTQESFELDSKKELKKNRQEIAETQQKIDELRGTIGYSMEESGALFEIFGTHVTQALGQKITPAMEEAGRDFITLGEQAKQGLDSIKLGILAQDFTGAINTLSTAIDGVPERYRGNFSEIDAIIGNSALTQRQKVAQIVADYGSLEQAFKPLIVGAYELSRAQAEAAAGLDELSVAARSNMTDMSQAEGAWNKFLASLSPAQRDLPIIEDLIARVNAGAITHAEALAEAEAAGVSWSRVMGKDVMQSIKNVEKSFIDLGDGTSVMVANVNGQMVNLGRVSNTELGNLSDDLGGVQTSMSDTSQSAKTELENEATAAIGVFGKDGKFHFGTVVQGANTVIDIFKVTNAYAETYITKGAGSKIEGLATTMTETGKTVKTETDQWGKDFEAFKTKAISVINSIAERLKNTNLFNLLPSLGEASGDEGKGQVSLDQAHQMMGTGGKGGATGFGIPARIDTDISPAIAKLDQLKAYANTTTTQISSFFVVMETSIRATMTRIGTLGTIGFTPLQTAATTVTSQASASFVVMETSIKGTMTRIAAIFPTAFTTLYTYAQQNAGLAIGAFVTMEQGITQTMSRITMLFQPAFANLGPIATQATSLASAAFVTMESSIKGTLSRITASFNPAFAPLHPAVNKATSMSSASFVTMNTSIRGSLSRTTSDINKFTSSTVSSLNKVTSAANKAASAFNRMAAAARKAAAAASKVGGMEHGGSFIASAQKGFSGIVNRPTTFKGVRMGEGFAPELVTVQPLTRGTGNHNGPTVSAGSGGGGQQQQPIIINVILDGKVIDRRIEKVALNNIGFQI